MIAVLMLSAPVAGLSAGLSAAEQHRIVVYVLAGIVGLLVTGAISCAKVSRRRRASRLIGRPIGRQTDRPIGRVPGHPSSR